MMVLGPKHVGAVLVFQCVKILYKCISWYNNWVIRVEYFKYLHSMKNVARCTHNTESMLAMEEAAFNKNKILFTRKLDLNLTNNW